jgi:hypothetical protein
MDGFRTALVALSGLAVGLVTLRAVRERRASPRDEAETATEHAFAAAGHARVAGEKTIEYAREELEAVTADARDGEESDPSRPARRLRRVGKGWVRR